MMNLNSPKTYDSQFLTMEHGLRKAVTKYPGHENLVLEL